MRDSFFLLGAERAGLLLVELMLAAHPDVAWAGDFDRAIAFDAERARSLHARLRARSPARHLGLSVHGAYGDLVQLFPAARFIYLGRSSGRAAARPGPGAALRESDRAWRAIAAQIAPEQRLELRYEQLVAAPARELARVCARLGVRFEERLLRQPAPPRALARVRNPLG
ncbi:MAG TPA: sulfotransferase [Myxococcota bacterium]|nr:sulfotransferase [Myxococcota bacterium]